jgi:hypothetical protein
MPTGFYAPRSKCDAPKNRVTRERELIANSNIGLQLTGRRLRHLNIADDANG